MWQLKLLCLYILNMYLCTWYLYLSTFLEYLRNHWLNVVFKMSTDCSNTRKSSLFWNHRIAYPMNSCGKSTARQSSLQASARQCWMVLAWISDSTPALHPRHYNPMDFGLANSVINRFFQWNQGIFNLISCSLWKMHINSNIYNFRMQQHFATKFAEYVDWILLCSLNTVNLATKFATVPEISNFSYGIIFYWRALYISVAGGNVFLAW